MKTKLTPAWRRRDFLRLAGLTGLGLMTSARPGRAALPAGMPPAPTEPAPGGGADYTLRIGTGPVELAPDQIISTTTCNGRFPGPLVRLKEGQRTVVDIFNDTDTPEQLHWHGQFLPVDVDGAAEEGTPFIPARGRRRITLTSGPAGFRFYHTHVAARHKLNAGQYSGQVGPVYIEPRHEPGADDPGIFLVLKEFDPAFSRGGDIHPMRLHRHSFELTRIAGRPTSGVVKDVVMLNGYQEIEADFTADNPGRTLFHCHMQPHMDFGFMGLFNYA